MTHFQKYVKTGGLRLQSNRCRTHGFFVPRFFLWLLYALNAARSLSVTGRQNSATIRAVSAAGKGLWLSETG